MSGMCIFVRVTIICLLEEKQAEKQRFFKGRREAGLFLFITST